MASAKPLKPPLILGLAGALQFMLTEVLMEICLLKNYRFLSIY
jgi:hypothetical protein